MSKILRRPMFRGGRVAKASGGISQLRQGYNTGERVLSIYDQIQEKLPMPEKREPKGLSTGDYLIIDFNCSINSSVTSSGSKSGSGKYL